VGANNAVSRVASLLAVAVLPLAVGLDGAGTGPLGNGFPRAMLVCAGLCVAGSAVAFQPSAAARSVTPHVMPGLHQPSQQPDAFRATGGRRAMRVAACDLHGRSVGPNRGVGRLTATRRGHRLQRTSPMCVATASDRERVRRREVHAAVAGRPELPARHDRLREVPVVRDHGRWVAIDRPAGLVGLLTPHL
jgi:hypothetical protein